MKPYSVLLFAIILYSCKSGSAIKDPGKYSDENWITADSTVQIHTYTKEGYLDSSLISKYYLYNNEGNIDMVMSNVIIRIYDTQNNLVSEREFFIKEDKRFLSNEKTKQYDQNNNLILDIDKSNSIINKLTKKIYNKNRLIKEIKISRAFELKSEEWTIDSVIAHLNDKKITRFDTTVVLFFYDSKGKLIEPIDSEEVETYPQIDTISNQRILYANKYQKGDTTITYEYVKDLNVNKYLSIDSTWEIGDKELKWVHYNNENNENRKRITRYDKKGNEIETVSYISQTLHKTISEQAKKMEQ